MAASAGIIGYGVTLGYATTGTTTYTTVGEIIDLGGPNIDTDDVELTHSSSPDTFKEYCAGLGEPGEFECEVNYDKTNTASVYALHRSKKSWKVTLPDSSTWVAVGYLKTLGNQIPVGDRVTQTWAVKLTGKPTFTAG